MFNVDRYGLEATESTGGALDQTPLVRFKISERLDGDDRVLFPHFVAPGTEDVPIHHHRWFEHAATRVHPFRIRRVKHQGSFFIAQEVVIKGRKQVSAFRYIGGWRVTGYPILNTVHFNRYGL